MSDPNREPRAVTRLVSTAEREQAVKLLTAAFADDVLPVDEFERRVARVYEAESAQALKELTRDLPVAAPESAGVPARVDQPRSVMRRPSQRMDSVLSSVERAVQGPVPEVLDLRSVMGSLELDLRRAEFPPGVTEIHVRAIAGNIEVELPTHVRVEHEGRAFLGAFSVKGRSRVRGDQAAPLVRITGRSILGNVEVELDD